MIAFDIAVLAQNLKKWVVLVVITNRSGWLLELLTELIRQKKS